MNRFGMRFRRLSLLCAAYVRWLTLDAGFQKEEPKMVGLLLLVLLLVLLFGALGVALSPLFFVLLVAVLLIAGLGGGRRWSSRW